MSPLLFSFIEFISSYEISKLLIWFTHSQLPLLLHFNTIPVYSSVFPTVIPLSNSTTFPIFPPIIIPPSLVFSIAVIWSDESPPIVLAHSHSPFCLYFIIIPSSYCFLFTTTSFPNSNWLLLVLPAAINPPSGISTTPIISSSWPPVSFSLSFPIVLAHSASLFALYFIIIPSLYPGWLLFNIIPFSNSKLGDIKLPPTIIPPSEVSFIEFISSLSWLPIVLVHSNSPLLLYLIIMASEYPLFISFSLSSNINESQKQPATKYPPSDVSSKSLITTDVFFPIAFAHSTFSSELYFIINPLDW